MDFTWLTAPGATLIAALVGAGATVLVALFIAPFVNRRSDERKAKRDYEYEARKRLYTEIEPLLFQLREAADGAYRRVQSLARTRHEGHLGPDENWLDHEGYYLRSTIYRLLVPGAILRIMQRRLTLVDMRLDAGYAQKYRLLKHYADTFTNDFKLARLDPEIAYDPHAPVSDSGEVRDCHQALVQGDLDNILDALIIGNGKDMRPRTFGEFEACFDEETGHAAHLKEAVNLFSDFTPSERPVLARMLHAVAGLAHILLRSFEGSVTNEALATELESFIASRRFAEKLSWDADKVATERKVTLAYLRPRVRGAGADEGTTNPAGTFS